MSVTTHACMHAQTQKYILMIEMGRDIYEDFLKFLQCLLNLSQPQPITNLCLYQTADSSK